MVVFATARKAIWLEPTMARQNSERGIEREKEKRTRNREKTKTLK